MGFLSSNPKDATEDERRLQGHFSSCPQWNRDHDRPRSHELQGQPGQCGPTDSC